MNFKAFAQLFLCVLVFSNSLQGQGKKHVYQGPFTVNSYKGEAQFAYNILQGDTTFNGNFSLTQSNLNKLISGFDSTLQISGTFDNGVAHGPWIFEFGKLKANHLQGNPITQKQYQINVDGTNHSISGTLNAGKPMGTWTQRIEQLFNSKVESTVFESAITFNNGIPQENFKLENEKALLIGFFLRDGLANDQWELYSKVDPDKSEVWIFESGLLKQIKHSSATTTTTVNVFKNSLNENTLINLDSNYIAIVNLQQELNAPGNVRLNNEVSNLLKQNANGYSKIDTLLNSLGSKGFMPKFKVLVPNFPLSSREISLLDSISLNQKRNKLLINHVFNSSQLNILKLADTEVLLNLKALEYLSKHHLALIGKVTQAYHHNILKHINREAILKQLCETYLCSAKMLKVKDEKSDASKTFTVTDTSVFNFDSPGIEGIFQFSRYINELIASIENNLNAKLDVNIREQEQIELEETLFKAIKKLNKHIDSLSLTSNKNIEEVLFSIKEFAEKELSTYSTSKNKTTEQADKLLHCLNNLQGLTTSISKVPSQQEELNQLYTDAVWNPFTSTVMNEDVKNKVKTAYNNVLIPYLLEEASNNLSCDKTIYLSSLLKGVYERMKQLRNEETNKLERKLKKEKDPLVVLDLFSITIKVEL